MRKIQLSLPVFCAFLAVTSILTWWFVSLAEDNATVRPSAADHQTSLANTATAPVSVPNTPLRIERRQKNKPLFTLPEHADLTPLPEDDLDRFLLWVRQDTVQEWHIAKLLAELMRRGLEIEDVISAEELQAQKRKACRHEIKLQLQMLRNYPGSFILLSEMRGRLSDCGFTLEELDTSEDELKNFERASVEMSAKNTLNSLRERNASPSLIRALRIEAAQHGFSLADIGTSVEELDGLYLDNALVRAGEDVLNLRRGDYGRFFSDIEAIRTDVVSGLYDYEQLGTTREEIDRLWHEAASAQTIRWLSLAHSAPDQQDYFIEMARIELERSGLALDQVIGLTPELAALLNE